MTDKEKEKRRHWLGGALCQIESATHAVAIRSEYGTIYDQTVGNNTDSDNDGYSDYAEYVFGTLPEDDGSRFYWSVDGAFVSVGTASNRIYWIDWKSSMMDPWKILKRFGGDGTTNQFNLVPEGDTGYFRIRATSGNVLEVQ